MPRSLAVFAFSAILASCGRERPPAPLVADVFGTTEVPGLSAPVRVARDRWGVPHIYARSRDDLFFAQGFVQAQDRLFQMDLWRRSSQGRLSEVLGPNFAARDAMTRRIQFAGDRDAEWARYGPDANTIANAFIRGVNRWAELARDRPPEEFVLAGWKPDLWQVDDLLNRTDAFVEGRDALEEIFRARLVAALGARRVAEIFPSGPALEVPRGLDPSVVSPVVGDAIRSIGAPPFILGLAKPVTVRLKADATDTEVRLKPDTTTDTTADVRGVRLQPDLRGVRTLPHPSPRYLVHLNAPGWNVIGATAPWRPGVEIGHNDSLAWDMEPIDADTEDVYVERVNPANPHQVDDNGRWADTEIVKAALAIRGRNSRLVFDVERTAHGVILAVDRERHLAFTMRWIGTGPGAVGQLTALDLDRASTVEAFRAVLERWTAPVRRITVADKEGRRVSEPVGLIPVRRGADGRLPSPAWNGANEWTGWRRITSPAPASPLATLARQQPNRADTLLRELVEASRVRKDPAYMRAVIVNALAGAMPATTPAPALFAHVLGIGDAARRRFNVGPVRPESADARPFAIAFDPADWDTSTAMNAPGQSASPDSAHFADLARLWAAGGSIPLAFSDRAVQMNTEATLVLAPVAPKK